MQGDFRIYTKSENLYEKLKRHFFESSEMLEGFQISDLVFLIPSEGCQRLHDEKTSEARILMDEDYETLIKNKARCDLTLWMNQDNALAPDSMPEQDFDFARLDSLVELPTMAPRPSVSQCLNWWVEWDLPENVQRHVTVVAASAYKLAVWLRQAGVDLDPILVHRAALVHDLDKIATLHQAGQHGHVSAEFLVKQGYSQLADIVRGHLLGLFISRDLSNFSWEMKIVNFCDKLVEGDQIVPLATRFSALKQRYPQSSAIIDAAQPGIWLLNDDICSKLALDGHETLISRLNK